MPSPSLLASLLGGITVPSLSLGSSLEFGVSSTILSLSKPAHERRPAPGKSKVMNVIGNVKDKNCIIVDDIIDSGGTIVNAAKALKDKGAKDVYVYITHGVLTGEAIERIKNSVIKNLVITDTIDNEEKVKKTKNIEVLPISNLMGEAIKRISNSTSVSDLFK